MGLLSKTKNKVSVRDFLKKLIDTNDPLSVKRFATLVTLGHFVLTGFLITFFVFYLVMVTPKGTVNKELLGMLEKILDNELIIILGGLGLMAVSDIGAVILQKAKAKVLGDVAISNNEGPTTQKTTAGPTTVQTTITPDDAGEVS